MKNNIHWIGIGASAGGLEALKELLQEIKSKSATYIIAQHLDPKHPTILKDLLERVTSMKIHLIEEDTKPNAGEVYIISPGHNAIIENEKIILKPAAAIGPKPSINEFFASLASSLEERSIGVILSGTGSDGAQGVIAIKANGGIVFAQDEISAKYTGMPRSAIETGVVDFVLTPAKIAQEINAFLELSLQERTELSSPKSYSSLEKIFQRLYDQTNYDFSGYKLKTIQRRIQRRMVVNKVVLLDDYVTLLMSSGSEVESLFRELLISVTSFFRDKEAFEDLSHVVENLVESVNAGNSLRIWVPGCANGEEAYSIAILVQEAIYKLNKEVQYQIFATDIDDAALLRARQGSYSYEQIKEIDSGVLAKYFNEYENFYIIKKQIRDHVIFAKQNLIMDPPFSHLDLISCRNVMIYFNSQTQKGVFGTFHFALKNSGYLFLGKSESAANAVPELFEIEKSGSQIFKRRFVEVGRKESYAKMNRSSLPSFPIVEQKIKFKETLSLQEKMEQTLMNEIIPSAVVINSQGHMLHVRGDMSRYLRIPEGRVDNNILTMAQESLKIDIRSLMQRAKRGESASAQALFYQHEKKDHILYLMITPLEGYEKDDLFVLAFFDLKLHEEIHPKILSDEFRGLNNDQLQQEVEIFRQRLQSSISDLETTNEELQSTNEELQSANEELQSANEELQTANEELSTVNEELEVKTFELSQVNNDLESMLTNIDEVILFVDTRLRIQRYTNKAAKLFKLNRDDIGQVITSYDLSLDIPNIRIEILNIIETEQERTIELRSKSMRYNLRLVSYKASDGEVVGVMLFFERHTLNFEERDKMHFEYLKLIDEHSKYSMLCLTKNREIIYVGKSFADALGYEQSFILEHKMELLLAQKSINEDFFTPTLANEGWRTLTLERSDGERVVTKYKVQECVDKSFSEIMLFFQV